MSLPEALLFAAAAATLAIVAIGLVAWLEAPVEAPMQPDTSRGLQAPGHPTDAPIELG